MVWLIIDEQVKLQELYRTSLNTTPCNHINMDYSMFTRTIGYHVLYLFTLEFESTF